MSKLKNESDSIVGDTVLVAIANTIGEKRYPVEDVLKWNPTHISYIGDAAMFKAEGTMYSMNVKVFNQLFKK